MNYRHIYHAGNFADVFKHSILTSLLEYLCIKESGFCYIETHAGIGLYDLLSIEAQKTKESEAGIIKLLQCEKIINELKLYLDIVKKVALDATNMSPTNIGAGSNDLKRLNDITVYPGSPLIADYFLRIQDKAILNELHREDFASLKKLFRNNKQIHCHNRDAYEFLKASLPPTPNRGLILIDPPYEKLDEYQNIIDILLKSIKLFPNGIFAVWYPIVSKGHKNISNEHKKFLALCKRREFPNRLNIELCLRDDLEYKGAKKWVREADKQETDEGLIGCGMFIINPPFNIEQKLNNIAKFLQVLFTNF